MTKEEKTKNVAILTCGNVCFDWYEWKDKEIDLDKYLYFELDYRLQSWHVIGFYRENDEWKRKEISDCEASFLSLVDFIIQIDGGTFKKIHSISNCHNQSNFFEAVKKLVECVEKKKNTTHPTESEGE